jgi:hypothetical protein
MILMQAMTATSHSGKQGEKLKFYEGKTYVRKQPKMVGKSETQL